MQTTSLIKYLFASSTIDSQNSPSAVPMNNFNNDGSFLENFKKISEQVQAKMKQTTSPDEESEKGAVVTSLPQFAIPPPSFAGNIPNVNIFNPHVPPPPPESISATITTTATPATVPLLPELDIRNIKG